MTSISEFRQRITLAADDTHETIALLAQMIREGLPPQAVLDVVDIVSERVDIMKTAALMSNESATEIAIALVHYRQELDKAYRDRSHMERLLRNYQEGHISPAQSSANLKENMEKKQAAFGCTGNQHVMEGLCNLWLPG